MADEVEVRFGAQIEGVVAGVNQVKEQIESLGASVSGITDAFKGIGEALVGLFAVEKIEEFTEHMSEMGEQAIRTSEMLGMSVEKVQELNFASELVGGGADGAALSLTRLERNMAEAQSGTGKAYEAFRNLGISLDDLKTKSPDEIMGQVANAFAGAENGATKTAYAMDLMGRSGAQLIPLLNQGSEGLERMGMIGRQTGSILSGEQAEAFEKTHQGLTVMDESFKGIAVTLFDAFRPAIDAIVGGLTDLAQWFNESIKTGGGLRPVIIELAGAFDALVFGIESGLSSVRETIAAVELALRELMTLLSTIAVSVKDLFAGLGQAISDALHGRFSDISADFKKGVDQMEADWKSGMSQMSGDAATFADDVLKTWTSLEKRASQMWQSLYGGGSGAGESGAKGQLPPAPASGGDKNDDTATQIAADKIKTEEELAKLGLQTQKDMLQQEVAAKQITATQEFAILQDYLTLEYQVESEALDKKLNLYAEDSREYGVTLNQKRLLDAQYQQQLARLAAQGAQAQNQDAKKVSEEYKSVTEVISRSFDGALQGILQGTQSWQVAMGNLFSNVASAAVEAIGKIIAEWLVFEVVTEGQGTWGDFMALEKPGGSGVSSLLPSFDVGSYSVPSDMVAQIHKNEMIIPAQQASQIRSGAASIGASSASSAGNFTININAIDTQSGAAFLKSNAHVIAQAMSGQMRNFNPRMNS